MRWICLLWLLAVVSGKTYIAGLPGRRCRKWVGLVSFEVRFGSCRWSHGSERSDSNSCGTVGYHLCHTRRRRTLAFFWLLRPLLRIMQTRLLRTFMLLLRIDKIVERMWGWQVTGVELRMRLGWELRLGKSNALTMSFKHAQGVGGWLRKLSFLEEQNIYGQALLKTVCSFDTLRVRWFTLEKEKVRGGWRPLSCESNRCVTWKEVCVSCKA